MWKKSHSNKSLLLLIFHQLVSPVKHHFNLKLSLKQLFFCLKRNNIHIKYHFIINLSGEAAKNCSGKIKRRYLAKRLELRKVDRSGTFSSVVGKARKDLNAYSVLFWIEKYLKPRQTKSNIKNINLEMSADEEESSEAAENAPSFQEFDDQHFDEEQIPDVTQKRKSALQSEKPKRAKNFTLEEKHLSILNRIDKELKERSETKETQDEEYFYGQTVAASVRKLRDMEKCMIKHEINNILFKYQMSMYKTQNTANPSQRIAYPTPPIPTRFSVFCNFQRLQLATYPCIKFLKNLPTWLQIPYAIN